MLCYINCEMKDAITIYELITRIGNDNGYKVNKTATVNGHYSSPLKNILNRSMVFNIDYDNKIISISCYPKKDHNYVDPSSILSGILRKKPNNFNLFKFILDRNLKLNNNDIEYTDPTIKSIFKLVSSYPVKKCENLQSLINLNYINTVYPYKELIPDCFEIEFLEKAIKNNEQLNLILLGPQSLVSDHTSISLLNNDAFAEIFGCSVEDLIANVSSIKYYVNKKELEPFKHNYQNLFITINNKIISNGEHLSISDMSLEALSNALDNLDSKYGIYIRIKRIEKDTVDLYKVYCINVNMYEEINKFHILDMYFIEISNNKNNGNPIISKKELVIINNKLELI